MPPKRPCLIKKLIRLPRVGPYVRSAHDLWIRSTYNHLWDARNKRARQAFEQARPVLEEEQARVLADLRDRGLGHIRFDQLFDDPRLLEDLTATVTEWRKSLAVTEKVKTYSEKSNRETSWKEYIVRYYSNKDTLPWDSPLLQLGLHPKILDIVNSNFGLMAKLSYVDVWNTVPAVRNREISGSQRWHRDPEDRKLVKVWLYLTDVDAASGPLHYVPHSRRGERYGALWPQRVPYGSYPPADEFEAAIPRSEWEACTYPAGTFVFADTSGFHMGGRATRRTRVFATWTFVSHASPWPRRFSVADKPDPSTLTTAVRYALQ